MRKKLLVPSRFAQSGVRRLTSPVSANAVEAPAYRRFRATALAARERRDRDWDEAKAAYVEELGSWCVRFLFQGSRPTDDQLRLASFIAKLALEYHGAMIPEGHGSHRQWSKMLGGLEELAEKEEETWERLSSRWHSVEDRYQANLRMAERQLALDKRELWREVTSAIRNQVT